MPYTLCLHWISEKARARNGEKLCVFKSVTEKVREVRCWSCVCFITEARKNEYMQAYGCVQTSLRFSMVILKKCVRNSFFDIIHPF